MQQYGKWFFIGVLGIGGVLAAAAVAAAVLACAPGRNGPDPAPPELPDGTDPVPITEIESLFFSERGSAVQEISAIEFVRADEGTLVRLELRNAYTYEQQEDAAVLDEVEKILTACEVGNWNGFHGSDPEVLDGTGFSLYIRVTDGTTLSAGGTNRFPARYTEVRQVLNGLTDSAYAAWLQTPEGQGG